MQALRYVQRQCRNEDKNGKTKSDNSFRLDESSINSLCYYYAYRLEWKGNSYQLYAKLFGSGNGGSGLYDD